jgi:hypothetical protein
MKDTQNDMVRVYSDSEIIINMLRGELAKVGIPSLVKNEFQSGVMAGFGASPNAVDIYVNAADTEAALSLMKDLNLRGQD